MEQNKVIQMQDKEDTKIRNTSEQQVSGESKISVLDFIKKYNSMTSDKAKKTYLQRVVKGDDYYIPYTAKVVYARNILEIANFDKEGNVLYNTSKQFILYVYTLLQMYTLLSIDHMDWVVVFDILNSNNVLDEIINALPKDRNDFEMIYKMVQEDFEKNYRVYQLNTKEIVDAVQSSIMSTIHSVLTQIQNDTKISSFVDSIIAALLANQESNNSESDNQK